MRQSQKSLVVLDVDGVLTDGQDRRAGSQESLQHFDVMDGPGIKMPFRRDRCCRDHCRRSAIAARAGFVSLRCPEMCSRASPIRKVRPDFSFRLAILTLGVRLHG